MCVRASMCGMSTRELRSLHGHWLPRALDKERLGCYTNMSDASCSIILLFVLYSLEITFWFRHCSRRQSANMLSPQALKLNKIFTKRQSLGCLFHEKYWFERFARLNFYKSARNCLKALPGNRNQEKNPRRHEKVCAELKHLCYISTSRHIFIAEGVVTCS